MRSWPSMPPTAARRVHVFRGEYEGYTHLATALGLEVVAHAREAGAWRQTLAACRRGGGPLLAFQPSAIDGNLWPGFAPFRDELARMVPRVPLVVDLTYVGAVALPPRIDVDHEVVEALLFSLSKPFGVYYHRIGGLVARAEVPSLRGHHWFKNLFSVMLGERLLAAHGARDLPARYQSHQREAILRAKAEGALPPSAVPSDVVMLAHVPAPADTSGFEPFERAGGLRFCLSPAMDRSIQP